MKHAMKFVVGVLILALTACGPSPEQMATMTASAWTPTPPPTATPTPIPYDVNVSIVDGNGAPIAGASVVFPASGKAEPVQTDAQGKFSWNNLPGDSVSLTVSAQGYVMAQQTATLQRGPNEITVMLARAPFGLLPSEACAPGETLLYAEDFQDGAVDNWNTYPPGTAVSIESDPVAAENKVLTLNFGSTDGEYQIKTIPLPDNVVRRLKYKPGNHSRFHVGWGTGNNGYFTVLSSDQFILNITRDGSVTPSVGSAKPVMQQGIWHLLEIITHAESIEIWADGAKSLSYQGPPYNGGDIMDIGSAYLPVDSMVYIDDVSMCGSSGPFTSIYKKP